MVGRGRASAAQQACSTARIRAPRRKLSAVPSATTAAVTEWGWRLMRGSVRKSDGGWLYVVDMGNDPATGSGVRSTSEVPDAQGCRGGSCRGAEREEPRRVRPAGGGHAWGVPHAGSTAGRLICDLRRSTATARSSISESSRHWVRAAVGARRCDVGGVVRTPTHGWRRSAQLDGGRSGRRWSGGGQAVVTETVANTAGVPSIAMADAVRLKLLRHNPTSEARLPRRERREMNAWSADEAVGFLAACRD